MKEIQTCLTEKQFLQRCETLCKQKTLFDKGYKDRDILLSKENKTSSGWKHYAQFRRTDGFAIDILCCQYLVNENGFVTIRYRFGKRLIN